MPIKINGATSGSTTITAPATGGDESIELSTALASKLPYSYGTATPSTTDSGFLWYDSNSTPAAPKFWDGAAFQALGGGGVFAQIVRATDSTQRSTTSTSYADVTGMTVTITPTTASSAVLIVASFGSGIETAARSNMRGDVVITDSSNNAISGGEQASSGWATSSADSYTINAHNTVIAYATPATTSAVTYKLRFRISTGVQTYYINNHLNTGQMYAIEVL